MTGRTLLCVLVVSAFACGSLSHPARAGDVAKRKVVVLAGKKSHGPEGNGIHDYGWSAKAIKVMLDNSNVADRVETEIHLNGWQKDLALLDTADAIVIISDGRDGDLYSEALHLESPDKIELISKQAQRGCGIVTFHFSTFAPDRYAEQVLDWIGGYFDWETDGKRQWYSAIQVADTDIDLPSPDHPTCQGVKPFRLNEEFYFNLRFHQAKDGVVPILSVPALPGREPDGRVVAWARQRRDGGRGFGTTCGHFYDNWRNPDFRRLVLNGLVWAAKAEVPSHGVESTFYTRDEITQALQGKSGTAAARVDQRPIRVLLFAGNEAHKWHNWEKTTPAIRELLQVDPRIQVDVSLDIEDLARKDLASYQTILMNYANWHDPRSLSDAAKSAFTLYLKRGGGLVVVHFANGAFHFSLPEAGASDWPEYRKVVRRVWNHEGQGDQQSGHDAYGPFRVDVTKAAHPITDGLSPFDVVDELYFHQAGDEPIEPLLSGRSKVTGQDEPLAFAYRYGDGRIFQTFLGHGERTYEPLEAREVLRRAVAWTAGRPIRPRTIEEDPGAKRSPPRASAAADPLVPGRFGKAMNAKVASATAAGRDEYRTWPLTVECWARLDDRSGFNILVACDPKSSSRHWELFTQAGSGALALYTPGRTPDHVRSTEDICDGRWHYVAATLADDRIALFVDGREIAIGRATATPGPAPAGGLSFGTLVERGLGCAGLIDEVRIRRGVHAIGSPPDKPFEPKESTIGLWHFDKAANDEIVDFSPGKNPARLTGGEKSLTAQAQDEHDDHYSEAALGFRWTEQDSVDNRWNQTQVGPFLASIVQFPGQPPVCKGLSIKVGAKSTASVLYDTQTMAFRAAWIDGFLKFDPARFGLISPPTIAGQLRYLTLPYSPTQGAVDYRGLYWNGRNVVLSYRVAGREVLERPAYEKVDDSGAFVREIEFAPWQKSTTLVLGVFRGPVHLDRQRRIATLDGESPPSALGVDGDSVSLESPAEGTLAISVPPARQPTKVRVVLAQSPVLVQKNLDASPSRSNPTLSLHSLQRPGPRLWTQRIVTAGRLGNDEASYAIDELTLPFDNPYRALLFVSGHDFFSDGDLAVCTAHGDVWRVSGVDATLKRLEWKRFATGLFQALGLRVIDDAVFVLGRDQITKLIDEDGDGQADRYECFHNGYETSSSGHDFVTCLETDAEGNFYFLHATQGLIRVSKDGKREDVVATGFRNPNGLGVFPDGSITVAPQEGEWTPSSAIIQIKPGGFYGYKGPRPTSTRPLGYDPPLCWIPRLTDNSGGGQVWSPVQNWGPLANHPIHLSYGQCRMQILLRENVGDVTQGGVAPLPYDFRSGIMRGRVNPTDGQLYVSGLKGWVTSAVDDGCLCRVRWTGKQATLPIAVHTYRNGLSLEFSDALDPSTAEDPDRYSIFAWNYRYAAEYGSADYRPSDPKSVGRDEWTVASATLLPGGRSVFLEIPDIQPVMQFALDYRLKTARFDNLDGSVYYTLHTLGVNAMPTEKLAHRPRPGKLPDEIEARLESGVLLRFEQNGTVDAVAARTLAWAAPPGGAPTSNLEPGPFDASAVAFLKAPTPATYTFAMSGNGTTDLAINGQSMIAGADLTTSPSCSIELHKGHNAIEFRYTSPQSGPSSFRVLWESEFFAREPLPPASLSHDSVDKGLVRGKILRRGKDLWESYRCAHCHFDQLPPQADSGPSLEGVGSRFEPAWLAQWIANPRAIRPQATMPTMYSTTKADSTEIADLVAYMTTLTVTLESEPSPSPPDEAKGLALYENLGCIACHRSSVETKPDGRISLTHVASKFRPRELERFLRNPREHFTSTRMPDFALTVEEARSLAAYLRSTSKSTDAPTIDLAIGNAHRGRDAFRARGCANCHAVDRNPDPPKPIGPMKPVHLDAGCLVMDASKRGTAPHFAWTNADRQALVAWLEKGPSTRSVSAPADDVESLYQRLNCQACHSRDGRAGARGMILAEESEIGLAPESLPDLTWAGEKLRGDWLKRQFAGELSYRSRPWLKARMPAFPAFADKLAIGIAAQHGLLEQTGAHPIPVGTDPPTNADAIAAAEKLISTSGGLDCRSCHAVGDQKPTGDDRTQISPGINFVQVRDRMRPEHFQRFLLDPPRFDIATRMPKLSVGGRTKVTSIYDGYARRQFDAIWRYIQSLPDDGSVYQPKHASDDAQP